MTVLAAATSNNVGLGPAIAFIVIGTVLYFVPLTVAVIRRVRHLGAVAVINIFLGWTMIGWVVALAMACRSKAPQPVTQEAAR